MNLRQILHLKEKEGEMSSSAFVLRDFIKEKRGRNILFAALGVVCALAVTALLALPHLNRDAVEAAAPVEAAPTPEIPQGFIQLSDPLLILVNDEVTVPAEYTVTTKTYGGVAVGEEIYTPVSSMMEDAYREGHVLWLASGYRSVENQAEILEDGILARMRNTGMTREEAYEDARLTIQAPGCSEHHTGLAVDFNEVNYDFEESGEYKWLQAHAAEYGFVERYPKGKEDITGIDYEPWHYRYVGTEHAQAMNELDMCLEEYVEYCRAEETRPKEEESTAASSAPAE